MTYMNPFLLSQTNLFNQQVEIVKKSMTIKEIPPNGKEFCLIACKAKCKCSNVSCPFTDISSMIKPFHYWHLFSGIYFCHLVSYT